MVALVNVCNVIESLQEVLYATTRALGPGAVWLYGHRDIVRCLRPKVRDGLGVTQNLVLGILDEPLGGVVPDHLKKVLQQTRFGPNVGEGLHVGGVGSELVHEAEQGFAVVGRFTNDFLQQHELSPIDWSLPPTAPSTPAHS